jgi:hypothetical protein
MQWMYAPHSMHVSMQLLGISVRNMESFTVVEIRACIQTTLINFLYKDIEAKQWFSIKFLTHEIVKIFFPAFQQAYCLSVSNANS